MLAKTSYSSAAEDLIIAKYFPGDYVGSYLDIGCWRPVQASNTYHFYQKGWRGLCIDAADFAAEYKAERPEDVFVQSGVGMQSGTLPYYVIAQDTSCNTFSKEHAETIKRDKGYEYVQQDVPVRTLPDILGGHDIARVDFINIDVEGMDLAILKQIDLQKYKPRVVAIEDLSLDLVMPISSPIVIHMLQQGYLFHSKCYLTLIFIRPGTMAEMGLFEMACKNANHVMAALNKAD